MDWRLDNQPRLKPICALLLTIIAGWQAEARAGKHIETFEVAQTEFAQVEFESGFLQGGAGAIDVTRYERGNVVRPGRYTPTSTWTVTGSGASRSASMPRRTHPMHSRVSIGR